VGLKPATGVIIRGENRPGAKPRYLADERCGAWDVRGISGSDTLGVVAPPTAPPTAHPIAHPILRPSPSQGGFTTCRLTVQLAGHLRGLTWANGS
jgi:hypothetical protein